MTGEIAMSLTSYDQKLFADACAKIIKNERTFDGIGTLKEKTVHAVMKNFYEADTTHQEVKIGNFIADIFRDGEIIEVQTRNFNAMRKKLDNFLLYYPVTIVYPIVHTKWLYWIDETTGELSEKRKSPKTGSFYDAFYELYKIRSYLSNPNLHICLVLIDAEEYRILNGWDKSKKRGSVRYDRIPTNIVDELYITGGRDYDCLIPDDLPEEFCVKDYAKASKIAPRYAGLAINILKSVGVIKQTGKRGRSYLYHRS